MSQFQIFRPSLAGSIAIVLSQFAQAGCSGEINTDNPRGATSGGVGMGGSGVSDPHAGNGGAAVADGGANVAGSSAGGAATGGGGNGGSEPVGPDEPSPAVVRRLTHVEYDNTIFDLLGDDSEPSSAFEADVAQNSFTNNAAGQNVSPTLTGQYMQAAEALSRTATQNLPQLLGCDPAALGEEQCVQQFIRDFGERAWRRPLGTEEEGRLFDLFTTARAEFELDVAIQLVLQAFLQSPQFIYLLEPAPAGATPGSVIPLDSWKVATRLSYFLLGSLPDETLFAEAEAGGLQTPEAVAAQARRLLQLPAARERIGLFFTEWLRLRSVDRLEKDPAMFPDYHLGMGALMRQQVEQFAQFVILDQDGSAIDLLTAPYTLVTPELAPLYGVPAPASAEFTYTDLDPTQRAGLLTHVAFLANLAHANQTDPVVRGKFVRESLLCGAIPPPPPGAVIMVPEITPGSTTRERFTQHQEDPTCAGCHRLMDPIGLGFEDYDPLGQWRDTDNGLPVDATGEILGTDVAGTFDGAIELSQKLAASEQVMDCIARTWLRFALGRSDLDADAGALAVASERFRASGFMMKELLVGLTETRAFRYQVALDPNVSAIAQEEMP